ncbi:MAG: hypothetical protein WBA74_24705, partial [Cyclobacteriaceae bacterium]
LIFLECFDRDPRSCLGKNCEDLGKERIFTTRKLAVDKEGLEKILERQNSIIPNPYYSGSNLRHVDLPKPIFYHKDDACQSYEKFFDVYATSITGGEKQENFFELLFGTREEEGLLHETYTEYEPLLRHVYNYRNPLTDNSRFATVKSKLRDLLAENEQRINIQQIYEFLTVVISAYNEFTELSATLASECCPDKEFPLHLIIGKILYDPDKESDEVDILGESRYRQRFLQPEIHNSQKELRLQVINAHKRLILILESFDTNRVSGESRYDLKITPTITGKKLADRSIPFVFNHKQAGSVPGIMSTNLSKEWSYRLTTLSQHADRVLNYEDNLIIAGDAIPEPDSLNKTPLYYNTENYSYHVDGYYSAEADEIKEAEKILKEHFNIPFDTLKLNLGTKTADIAVEKHHWRDMQSDYLQIKSALIATVRNLLGYLKAFNRTATTWEYDLPYANVENFKKEITGAIEEITMSLGLCEEGERILSLLPGHIEELYNAGQAPIPFMELLAYHKTFRRNLSATSLKLEYAAEILTFEKIEVMPTDTYHDWINKIRDVRSAIEDYLTNHEFFQLFSLYHRFVNRYDYIQQNHYSVFCNFLKIHPGIEQKPISSGGTHILIYEEADADSEIKQPLVASFHLPYRLREKDFEISIDPSLDEVKLPPMARGEAILIEQGSMRLIDATANDLDPNGDPLAIISKGV